MSVKRTTAILIMGCLVIGLVSGCGKELKPDESPDVSIVEENVISPEQEMLVDQDGNPVTDQEETSITKKNPNEDTLVISREFEIEGGKIHSLPFNVSKLLKDGWVPSVEADKELGPNAVTMVTKFEREGKTLVTRVENVSNEVRPINECRVCAISMESESDATVRFEDFSFGSSFEQMQKVFGENEMDTDGNVIYLISANKQMQAHFTNNKCDGFSLTWMQD